MLASTGPIRIFLFIVLLLSVVLPAGATWTPFLNNYSPEGLSQMYQEQDRAIAEAISQYIGDQVLEGRYLSPPDSSIQPYAFQTSYWKTSKPFRCWNCITSLGNRPFLNFADIKRMAETRLLHHGFRVRDLEIYTSERGLHVAWNVEDPRLYDVWNRRLSLGSPWGSRMAPSPPWDTSDCLNDGLCGCSSRGLCRLKSFMGDPLNFIRNNF